MAGQHLQVGIGPSVSARAKIVAAQPSRWAHLTAREGSSSCSQMLLLYSKTIMTTAQIHLWLSFLNWKWLRSAQVILHSSQAPKLPCSRSNYTDQAALFWSESLHRCPYIALNSAWIRVSWLFSCFIPGKKQTNKQIIWRLNQNDSSWEIAFWNKQQRKKKKQKTTYPILLPGKKQISQLPVGESNESAE